MKHWRKYSVELQKALYDDAAGEVDLVDAIESLGIDFVREDKPRVEHLLLCHPAQDVRNHCLTTLIGWFEDPEWIPTALEWLRSEDTVDAATQALLQYYRPNFNRKREIPKDIVVAIAAACVRMAEYGEDDGFSKAYWRESADETTVELLRLISEPVPAQPWLLRDEAARLAMQN